MQDWGVAVTQLGRGGEPGDDTNPTRALTQLRRTSLPAQPQAQIEHLVADDCPETASPGGIPIDKHIRI